jgi:hypothetical protein
MDDVHAPFSEAEWEERKNYRSFDLIYIGYGLLAGFLLYRAHGDWPTVWCQEKGEEEE